MLRLHVCLRNMAILLAGASLFSCSPQPRPEQTVNVRSLDPSELPYRFSRQPQGGAAPHETWHFLDFNDDGLSEVLFIKHEVSGNLALTLANLDRETWQQFNVAGGKLYRRGYRPFLFRDLDQDDRKEFVFSYVLGDTTYLAALDHDFQTVLQAFPVAHATEGFGNRGDRNYEVVAKPNLLYDIDNNDTEDLICTFRTSFSPWPRGVFAYDWRTGKLLKSYAMPNNPDPLVHQNARSLWFEDFNSDGNPELVPARFYAVDNGVRVGDLDDSRCYLFVLDAQLNPLYIEELGGKFSEVTSFPVQTPHGKRLLTVFTSQSLQQYEPSELRIYNLHNFQIERRYTIAERLRANAGKGVVVDDLTGDGQPNCLVGTKSGKLYLFNWNLKVLATRQFSQPLEAWLALDLDGDARKEIICHTYPRGIVILNDALEIRAREPEVTEVQPVKVGRARPSKLFVVYMDRRRALLTYERNWGPKIPVVVWGLAGTAMITLVVLSLRWYHQKNKAHRTRNILMDFSAAGILHVDRTGKILACNQRAGDMLGASEDDLVGRRLTEANDSEDNPRTPLLQRLGRMYRARFEGSESHDVQTPEGVRRISVMARKILSPSGQFDGLLINLWDDTAALERERALSWASMAQRMAHEIKSPLSTIALTVQRLQMQYRKDGVANQQQYDAYVQSVLAETRHSQRVAKGFMQFVNLEKPTKEPVDLAEFFEEMKAKIKDRLPAGIQWQLELQETLPHLSADRILLESALQNLIDNAVDAMGREGVLSINVETAQHLHEGNEASQPQHMVCIEIADTGPGIAKEHQPELFKPYFTTKSTGVGLGLVITKKIVEDHGGAIYISSREGRGTSVYLYWPTVEESP